MTRRQALVALGVVGALIGAIPLAWSLYTSSRFPTDRTPEGCYVRIALAFTKSRVADCFPYLETASQHALFSIHNDRRRALERVQAAFEEPERSQWVATYGAEGSAPNPADLWAVLAKQREWDNRLRRDLSGVRQVEIVNDRATIETALGTRYPFRRAENGIWGLTSFTADLITYRDKAARDFAMVERAARDYEHAKQAK